MIRKRALLMTCLITYASAQQVPSDIHTLGAQLFEYIKEGCTTDQLTQLCDILCTHPTITTTQRRILCAHTLARAYRKLVKLNQKSKTAYQKQTNALAILSISGYLFGSIIANRLFHVGLDKKAAWFWFPLARACCLNEENSKMTNIGIGLLFAQLIAGVCVALPSFYAGTHLFVLSQKMLSAVKKQQASLTHLIKKLEGIYYAPVS